MTQNAVYNTFFLWIDSSGFRIQLFEVSHEKFSVLLTVSVMFRFPSESFLKQVCQPYDGKRNVTDTVSKTLDCSWKTSIHTLFYLFIETHLVYSLTRWSGLKGDKCTLSLLRLLCIYRVPPLFCFLFFFVTDHRTSSPTFLTFQNQTLSKISKRCK